MVGVILATSSSRQLGSRPLELCRTLSERYECWYRMRALQPAQPPNEAVLVVGDVRLIEEREPDVIPDIIGWSTILPSSDWLAGLAGGAWRWCGQCRSQGPQLATRTSFYLVCLLI